MGAVRIRVNAIALVFRHDRRPVCFKEDAPTSSDRILMDRIGQPGELKKWALFLASAAAAYITGQVLAGRWRRYSLQRDSRTKNEAPGTIIMARPDTPTLPSIPASTERSLHLDAPPSRSLLAYIQIVIKPAALHHAGPAVLPHVNPHHLRPLGRAVGRRKDDVVW